MMVLFRGRYLVSTECYMEGVRFSVFVLSVIVILADTQFLTVDMLLFVTDVQLLLSPCSPCVPYPLSSHTNCISTQKVAYPIWKLQNYKKCVASGHTTQWLTLKHTTWTHLVNPRRSISINMQICLEILQWWQRYSRNGKESFWIMCRYLLQW